ncbi:hypothetical protein M8J75_012975 [Diaphorina citri]|nr:hypothetical protein M8J75_012975 [Diaphorina citri]
MMEEMSEMPRTPSPPHPQPVQKDEGGNHTGSNIDLNKLSAKSLGASKDKPEWKCTLCGSVFKTIPLFAKHLHGHYTTSSSKPQLLKEKKNTQIINLNGSMSSSDNMLNANCEQTGLPGLVPSSTSLNLGDELQVMSDLNFPYISLLNSVPILCFDPMATKTTGSANFKPNLETKQMLACEICGKKFDKAVNIVRHLKKHAGEFHCTRCGKVFARKETLQVHECVDLLYNCDQCLATFTHVKLFREHKRDHHRRKGKYSLDSLSCGQCSHQSDSMANFIKHIRSHDMKEMRTSQVIKCSICGQSFTRARVFYSKHLRTHEASEYCHQCKSVFSGRKTYLKHWCLNPKNQGSLPQEVVKPKTKMIRRGFSKETSGTDTSGHLTCDFCLAHFDNEAGFHLHKKQHAEANIIQDTNVLCDHCGKAYESLTSLEKHVAKIHVNTKVTCGEPLCHKQFETQDQLLLHIQRHKDNKITYSQPGSYPCTYCGKTFSLKKYRTNHIIIKHTADYKYSCPICPKKFKVKTYLNSHMKHKHGNQPKVRRQTNRYSCHLCKRWFVKKTSLRKHIESHSVTVSYACSFCPKTVIRRSYMIRHLSSVHADKKHVWNSDEYFKQLMVIKDLSDKTPKPDLLNKIGKNQLENQNKDLENLENANGKFGNLENQNQAHLNVLDSEDNLLTEDPMKLFDLNTESNPNTAIPRQVREIPLDSITNFDLSVFYNDHSVELPCPLTSSTSTLHTCAMSSLCPNISKESDMVNNTFAMTTAANTTLPLTNSHLIADSLVLPLQTIQTSDIRVSAPLYKTLPVIDMQESYPSENFMYVVLDLPPSCHGSSRTDVVTIETAPRSSNVPIAPANET